MPRRPRPGQTRLHVEQLEDRMLLAADVLAALSGGSLSIQPFLDSSDAAALIGALLAPASNINLVAGSIQYHGADGQAGTYTNLDITDPASAVHLKIDNGILLTSGLAKLAAGSNGPADGNDDAGAGDSDLTALIGNTTTFDANVLTFQFTVPASAKSIQFQFVFGSEEFPVYVNSFNDVLGVFLDGKQIAFDNNQQPLTVNNNFFQFNNTSPSDTTNPNTAGKTVVNLQPLAYNGLTPLLVTTAPLDGAVAVHTIKFAIADAGDHALDSGVFLAGLKTSANVVGTPVTGPPTTTPPPVTSGGSGIPSPNSADGQAVELSLRVGLTQVPFSTGPFVGPTTSTVAADNQATVGLSSAPGRNTLAAGLGLRLGGSGGDVDILERSWGRGNSNELVPSGVGRGSAHAETSNSPVTLAGGTRPLEFSDLPDLYVGDLDNVLAQHVAVQRAFDAARRMAAFASDDEPALLVETSARARRLASDEGDEGVKRAAGTDAALGGGQDVGSTAGWHVPWTEIGSGVAVLAGVAGFATWGYVRRARSEARRQTSTAMTQ